MLEKPNKLRIALIAGVIMGVVSSTPGINLINCCCCAGIWLGGFLAMYFYKQQFTEGMMPLESSDALIVGLMSGVAAAFTATIIAVLILLILGPVEAEFIRSLMEKILDRLAENGSIPSDTVDQLREQFERSVKDSARISGVFGNLFVTLIIYPIFSILGALLGYAVFRPKHPPVPTPQA
ncbi:MAG: hypothetical protein HY276_11340 [Ignavibacteriales bacterium]|nr:hypothetical protein [Ignavibacteriales bacterium]